MNGNDDDHWEPEDDGDNVCDVDSEGDVSTSMSWLLDSEEEEHAWPSIPQPNADDSDKLDGDLGRALQMSMVDQQNEVQAARTEHA